MNLPNVLTIARAILVPIIIWLLTEGELKIAFILFVLAGISDAVDGYVAKTFNQRTEFGAYLDPLADKLLIVGIFVTLGWLGELPIWLVIAVVARDVLIVIAIMLSSLIGRPVHIRPLYVSKLNTTFQIILAATVLADAAFGLGLGLVRQGLIWATAAFTLLSFGAYIRAWLNHMTTGRSPAGHS